MNASSTPGTEPSKAGLKFKFMGVGGAGCRMVEYLAGAGFDGAEFYALHTDERPLVNCLMSQRVLMGRQMVRGLGVGGDAELAAAAAETEGSELSRICAGADIVFLVTALGGGTGTGAAPVVARTARQRGALVLAFAILPFDCEGKKRQRQALQGLRQLRASVDGVICLPNQRLARLVQDNSSLLDVFARGNGWLAEAVQGVWRMLARPGLITVDFAELKNCLRGRHSEGAVAAAFATGPDRARLVVEKIVASPMLSEGEVLKKSDTIILSIAGNASLSLPEVNQVVERIKPMFEKATFIMGANSDESLGDKIEVTVVATCKQVEPEPVTPVEEGPTPRRTTGSDIADLNLGLNVEPSMEEDEPQKTSKPRGSLLPPAPRLNTVQTEKLLKSQAQKNTSIRKELPQLLQGQLPLQVVSKGRFEKSEPTIHRGEDLDKPTFMRRSIPLN